ncbi:ABC transporter permease [Lachnotalea sp. AF33-28]|uniref:ABC transporter permease n=1 Tax=Lachnotalea sp. AF33-28 TaxID=2292046 RepID=UPI000E4C4569|nr:ABC transporter permease subunit [Lachnotalea sp. AF33-28]RHP31481.1 sugar ABC transporter permease [Lachnotalea sp. AF33-28]
MSSGALRAKRKKKYTAEAIVKDFKKHKVAYAMAVPGLIMVLLFNYMPIFGLGLAFVNYKPNLGIFGSKFVGLKYFKEFFSSMYFVRTVGNTLILSLLQIVFVFFGTILFALLVNELKNQKFKRMVQTVTYLPNFISMVVVAGIIVNFCTSKGVLAQLVSIFTGESKNLLSVSSYWRPLYIASDLWQGLGTGAIVYLAALAGIDQTLYEAAVIDGAGRWKQTLHVTLPGILPTIIIMLILKIGSIMSVGYEKTILLYNPQIYETADIISSFVYRKGLVEANYGFSTAVSLFNSVINTVLLITANAISRKATDNSLF